ncbi:hypothetical protein CEXT_185631, partial [Caerostris extrusa]
LLAPKSSQSGRPLKRSRSFGRDYFTPWAAEKWRHVIHLPDLEHSHFKWGQLWSVRRPPSVPPRERPRGFRPLCDASAKEAIRNAGAGVYSMDFALPHAIGRNFDNFDDEMVAISVALDKIEHSEKENIVTSHASKSCSLWNVDWATISSTPTSRPSLESSSCPGYPSGYALMPCPPESPCALPPCSPSPHSTLSLRSPCPVSTSGHRHLHVHLHTVRVFFAHGVRHRQHCGGPGRGEERLANKLLNDIQLIHMEFYFLGDIRKLIQILNTDSCILNICDYKLIRFFHFRFVFEWHNAKRIEISRQREFGSSENDYSRRCIPEGETGWILRTRLRREQSGFRT